MATLKQISELTGYSLTTVSRVLSEDMTLNVSDSTRKIILDTAGKLDYARKNGKSNHKSVRNLKIGIVEKMDVHKQLDDTYYLYLKNNVQNSCFEEGMETVMLQYDAEQRCYKSAAEAEIQGILAIGQFDMEQILAMEKWTEHLVFVDSSPCEDRFSAVVPNYQIGIYQGVDFLVEMGHRKLAFVGPKTTPDSMNLPALEDRRKIFKEYLKRKYPQIESVLIDTSRFGEEVFQKVTEYLQQGEDHATAFFAFNETTAMGILKAMGFLGYQVPEDFSILSYNDTVIASLIQPGLSSINIHLDEMAVVAVELLKQSILERKRMPLKVAVPSSLIKRESVKKLN